MTIEELKTHLCDLSEKTKLYNDEQIKDILTHLSRTFFENHRVFEFVINEPQSEVVITKEVQIYDLTNLVTSKMFLFLNTSQC